MRGGPESPTQGCGTIVNDNWGMSDPVMIIWLSLRRESG